MNTLHALAASGSKVREDVEHIIRVCRKHGYEISETDASIAWGRYSSEAEEVSWAPIPSSEEELFECVISACDDRSEDDDE